MPRVLPSLTVVLLAGFARAALASDCLTALDGLTVELDLPASEAMAGTQTGAVAPPPLQRPPAALPSDEDLGLGRRITPAGRSGLAELTAPYEPRLAPPPIPVPKPMSPERRSKLLSTLHEARAAEALNDEARCMDLLHQAQAIAKDKG
jgi:hypothetical protein